MNGEILRENLLKQDGRIFERDARKFDKETAFAICIKSDEENLLMPLKVYEVTLSKTEYVGVVGENKKERFIRRIFSFI